MNDCWVLQVIFVHSDPPYINILYDAQRVKEIITIIILSCTLIMWNQRWRSCMLISLWKCFSYCLCLLLVSFPFFLPGSIYFFSHESLFFFFFPTQLFCLAKFWGPLNYLKENLGKELNRFWIAFQTPFLHPFKKTREIFQRSSKRGSRTFGADVTLWHVTGNEW